MRAVCVVLVLAMAAPAWAQITPSMQAKIPKSTEELESEVTTLQKQARDKDAKIAEQQQALASVQKMLTPKDLAAIWTRLFKASLTDPVMLGCRKAGGRVVTKVDRQRQVIVFEACEF